LKETKSQNPEETNVMPFTFISFIFILKKFIPVLQTLNSNGFLLDKVFDNIYFEQKKPHNLFIKNYEIKSSEILEVIQEHEINQPENYQMKLISKEA